MVSGHSGSWPGFFRVFAVLRPLMLLLSQGAQELVSPSSGAWQVLSIYEGLTRWSMPALFLLWGMSALEGRPGGLSGLSAGAGPARLLYAGVLGSGVRGGGPSAGDGALSWSGSAPPCCPPPGETPIFISGRCTLWWACTSSSLCWPGSPPPPAGARRCTCWGSFLAASLLPLWAAFHPNHAPGGPVGPLSDPRCAGMGGLLPGGLVPAPLCDRAHPGVLIYLLGILGVVLTLAGPRLIGGGRELWYSYTAPGVACTAVALCVLFRYVLGVSEERSRRGAVCALGSVYSASI